MIISITDNNCNNNSKFILRWERDRFYCSILLLTTTKIILIKLAFRCQVRSIIDLVHNKITRYKD